MTIETLSMEHDFYGWEKDGKAFLSLRGPKASRNLFATMEVTDLVDLTGDEYVYEPDEDVEEGNDPIEFCKLHDVFVTEDLNTDVYISLEKPGIDAQGFWVSDHMLDTKEGTFEKDYDEFEGEFDNVNRNWKKCCWSEYGNVSSYTTDYDDEEGPLEMRDALYRDGDWETEEEEYYE